MKILIAHNRYQQPGGEDKVVQAEMEMLQRRGHAVHTLTFSNDGIHGRAAKLGAAFSSFFSSASYTRVLEAIGATRPDILHVHNFAPTLSPAVFFAGKRGRVPIVQTLHNYRLLCANGTMYRDGQACERCVEQDSILPGIVGKCYRGSRAGSAVVGATIALHGALGTWEHRVDRYIALTKFAAKKLGAQRLPSDRISIKPNFVADRGVGTGHEQFALFVGRLSEEKGIASLLAADAQHRLPLPVIVVGDGPLRRQVEAACARPGTQLRSLGALSSEQVLTLMKAASVLLVPSTCYEGFPVTIAEALSVSLPVIASRIGGLPEIVPEGECGLLHTPGDPLSIAETLSSFASLSDECITSMRVASRKRYSEYFSEDVNYAQLIQIYRETIKSAGNEKFGNMVEPVLHPSVAYGHKGE